MFKRRFPTLIIPDNDDNTMCTVCVRHVLDVCSRKVKGQLMSISIKMFSKVRFGLKMYTEVFEILKYSIMLPQSCTHYHIRIAHAHIV